MHIEVKGPDGKDAEWILTTGSANVMATLGVGANGPNSVKAGDVVTFTYHPATNGSTLGLLRSLTLADKREVQFEVK